MLKIIDKTELSEGLTSFRTKIEEELVANRSLQERYERYRSILNESTKPAAEPPKQPDAATATE